MPIYEYHCEACGADFEAIVAFRDADAVECEKCGSPRVQRAASMFACSMEASGGGGGPLPACGGGG
jgi:putative FmdB family regulatory protein